jgi:SagB-type dehydrogenase family enzyme
MKIDPDAKEKVLRFHHSGSVVSPNGETESFRLVTLNSTEFRQQEHVERPLTTNRAGLLKLPSSHRKCQELTRSSSAEKFDNARISNESEISEFLQLAFSGEDLKSRPYPSGGALYPVSVILMPMRARKSWGTSLFQYLPLTRALLPLRSPLTDQEWQRVWWYEEERGIPDFAIAYCVDVDAATFKYRSRGYRHALMEVGSMYQQATLVGQSLGMKNRLFSAFPDTELLRILGLNPSEVLIPVMQYFGFENSNV